MPAGEQQSNACGFGEVSHDSEAASTELQQMDVGRKDSQRAEPSASLLLPALTNTKRNPTASAPSSFTHSGTD